MSDCCPLGYLFFGVFICLLFFFFFLLLLFFPNFVMYTYFALRNKVRKRMKIKRIKQIQLKENVTLRTFNSEN